MGAWIETVAASGIAGCTKVAPYMGAWIETVLRPSVDRRLWSLPTWGRGLKLFVLGTSKKYTLSLPTWGRGLKPPWNWTPDGHHEVAPYMGAWIETNARQAGPDKKSGRSLHGGVD